MDRRRYAVPGGHISAIHYGRTTNPLKLVFCHANGFNARTYRTLFEPLGFHVLALDMRGHGMTELPTAPKRLKDWSLFARDIVNVFDAHIDRPVIVAGHSSGAVASLLAAQALGPKMRGYLGFDPVTLPALIRGIARVPGGTAYLRNRFPIARKAGKRRADFPSRDAMFDSYRGRGVFKRFPDAALRDYVTGGSVGTEDGVRLACAPAWEQAIFAAQGSNIYRQAQYLPAQRTIVYAGGPGAPHTAGARKKISRIIGPDNIEFRPESGHFFPIEEMDWTRDRIARFVREVALT